MNRCITIAAALLFANVSQDSLAKDGGCGEQGCITTIVGAGGIGHIYYPNSGMRTIDLTSQQRFHVAIHRHRAAVR
jgi:hypothetical protein